MQTQHHEARPLPSHAASLRQHLHNKLPAHGVASGETPLCFSHGEPMKPLLMLAVLLIASALSTGQAINPSPEQLKQMWSSFEKQMPVTAIEVRLVSQHPDLKFSELDELVNAARSR
jgi:hypothetical protein